MPNKKISQLFNLSVAKSLDTDDYENGDVPFVTSTMVNNGIVRYVTPLDGDKVFCGPCMVISGLGFASVHIGKFLPKGNGGDSCTVLFGKSPLSLAEYIAFASAFNCIHNWRFSFGRKCKKNRIENLEVPYPLPNISDVWPKQQELLNTCITNVEAQLNDKTVLPSMKQIGDLQEEDENGDDNE